MAVIEKRTSRDGKPRYRARIRMRGMPPETATFPRKTDAEKWAQDTEAAMRNGKYFKYSEAKRHTLSELIERYIEDVLSDRNQSSRHSQESKLRWWEKQLGDYSLSDVTRARIAECKDRLGKGLTKQGMRRSPSTVVRYMAALSHVFSIAVREWEWMDENPMRKVSRPKEPQGRVRFLSKEEREQLFDACKQSRNPFLYSIVVLAISTGMRRGELVGLRWPDVDLQQRRVVLHNTKNGERRGVPLPERAFRLLYEQSKIKRIDTDLVFPGRHRHGKETLPTAFQSAWKTAVKQAKLENFRFHDLRHTCASYLVMNGASIAEVAEVLGHKNLQMTMRYAHLSESHTSKVLESMTAKVFGAEDETQEKTV